MSKIVIDFKHEDVHQPRPWPVGISDGIVTSGLGQDDGAVLIGFAKAGEQGLAFMPEEIDSIDFEAEDIVPVFSANGGFFNWDLPIRGIRTIEEATLDAGDEAVVDAAIAAVQEATGPYGWFDFEPDTSSDNIPDKFMLTITEDGDELAVIVHRTVDGKYPLDGEVANQKRANAQRIVDALNAQAAQA